jgi:hypothetical protein
LEEISEGKSAVAESTAARRYGFVTEIKLEETEIRLAVADESKQSSGK